MIRYPNFVRASSYQPWDVPASIPDNRCAGSRLIQEGQLNQRYRPTLPVHGWSFELESGGMTGSLRPNWVRKSTTQRVTPGLDAPSPGAVR
jgi:ABC-type uncharacterized transport system ATPase subunit